MTRFLNEGFIDAFRLCTRQPEYTWWSYRFNSRAKTKAGVSTIAWQARRCVRC